MIEDVWIAPQYGWLVMSDNDAMAERGREDSKNFIWMQLTGLKDSEGKEIYEGDIVRTWHDWVDYSDCYEIELSEMGELNSEYETHQIKYHGDRDYPAFDLVPYVDCECNGMAYFASGCEDGKRIVVIGNIYENPELLENK